MQIGVNSNYIAFSPTQSEAPIVAQAAGGKLMDIRTPFLQAVSGRSMECQTIAPSRDPPSPPETRGGNFSVER